MSLPNIFMSEHRNFINKLLSVDEQIALAKVLSTKKATGREKETVSSVTSNIMSDLRPLLGLAKKLEENKNDNKFAEAKVYFEEILERVTQFKSFIESIFGKEGSQGYYVILKGIEKMITEHLANINKQEVKPDNYVNCKTVVDKEIARLRAEHTRNEALNSLDSAKAFLKEAKSGDLLYVQVVYKFRMGLKDNEFKTKYLVAAAKASSASAELILGSKKLNKYLTETDRAAILEIHKHDRDFQDFVNGKDRQKTNYSRAAGDAGDFKREHVEPEEPRQHAIDDQLERDISGLLAKKQTPYELLGLNIEDNPGPPEIKAAFRAQAMKYHPDKATGDKKAAEEHFKYVEMARNVLLDPKAKERIDKKIQAGEFGHSRSVAPK